MHMIEMNLWYGIFRKAGMMQANPATTQRIIHGTLESELP